MNKATSSAIDGLIGQANLKLAHGNSDEALALLHEAIRQDPRNVELYFQISNIYSDLDRLEDCFKYRHLAANLSTKTSAEEWSEVGLMALSLEKMDEAAACYEKATKLDPTKWAHYEKRIEVLEALGQTDAAMRTRLKAARTVNCAAANFGFEHLKSLIKEVGGYYVARDNEDRVIDALEALVLRSHEFGYDALDQHLTLLEMRFNRGRFDECIKSILTLQQGIRAVDKQGQLLYQTSWSGTTGCQLTPYPLPYSSISAWVVEDALPIKFLCHLTNCLIRLGKVESIAFLVKRLSELSSIHSDGELCALEVVKNLQSVGSVEQALELATTLVETEGFRQSPEAWHVLGTLYQACNNAKKAQNAYEMVIKLQPSHVDAKINLSEMLQGMGKADAALKVLKDCRLESCSILPDQRLLVRQADVLLEQHSMQQFSMCVRLLLVPRFFLVHQQLDRALASLKRHKSDAVNTLKKLIYQSLQGMPYQRMISRLGPTGIESKGQELTNKQLHDYTFKLAETLYMEGKFDDMLEVTSFAFLDPWMAQSGYGSTFKNLFFLATLKTKRMILAFEFVRHSYTNSQAHQAGLDAKVVKCGRELYYRRLFNAMNYALCNYQNIAYHRFVMRALAKNPDNYPLRVISGNNSLVTGSYRHALGEFYRLWLTNREDPLLCLLIALTFAHMACKKDISSRHMLAIRAVAFMKRYQIRRGTDSQEVNYNIGRFFHQLGVLPKAIHFYERALSIPPPIFLPECGSPGASERYDLRRLAAYNLALIYETSGNKALARRVLENYCSI